MDFCLILFNTSSGTNSIPKELRYTSAFLSVNNETQSFPLLRLLSRFITLVPSSVLGKLSLKKTPLSLGL